jgi:hypothetical protein
LDDVLDLRWKHKIALSFLAVVPLIVAYSGEKEKKKEKLC